MKKYIRFIIVVIIGFLLISCAGKPIKLADSFDLSDRNYLYNKSHWFFHGRLALTNKNDSLTVSIKWMHIAQSYGEGRVDVIKLFGPFGQGRIVIKLTEGGAEIDSGDERKQFVGDVDEQLSSYIGYTVPVSALRYWVIGLVKPKVDYYSVESGFLQSGWRVIYQKMQLVGDDELPRKIKADGRGVKLKLFVDEWGD